VSKLVNWGHWIVAAQLGIAFAVGVLLDINRGDGLLAILLEFALFFASVRGLIVWAKWAHALLVVMNLVFLGAFVYFMPRVAELRGARAIVGFATALATLVWLLLPSVRRQYWHPERVV
jgi:hypothetical protein